MPPLTIKKPRTLHWTGHSLAKMRQYRLSQARVKRILHSPGRVEEGIAPKTVAFMQPAGNVKNPYELWVMVQDEGARRKVISAWRYPGRTKLGTPLPREILLQLQALVEEIR